MEISFSTLAASKNHSKYHKPKFNFQSLKTRIMKTLLVLLSAFILLAIVAENTDASPAPQLGNTGGVITVKPGSCSRPQNGRRRRSLDEDVEFQADDDYLGHFIQKRQIQGGNGGGNGGNQGGNPWRPPTTTRRPPRPQCYSDNGCVGNKKCCNGVCQTPAFTG